MSDEMQNPFKNKLGSHGYSVGYSKFIRDQIIHLNVGESMMVDIGVKPLPDARRHVKKAVKCIGWKLKTKQDNNRNLWVMRVE